VGAFVTHVERVEREEQGLVNEETRRQTLVDALKHPTPGMRKTLRQRKEEGERELERPDLVWRLLLQSFATWGGSRGWSGLMGTRENYDRVTFEALSRLDPETRLRELEEEFLAAGVRYARMKANLMAKNYDLVAEMGGPEEAKTLAFAQDGRAAKIAFMKRFHGVGDKYARNIWMDCYHPDFRDAVAVDERIKKVTEALGYSFAGYDEHELFYRGVAVEAGLEPWEVDRLLYNHQDEFLAAAQAGGEEEEQSADPGDKFVRRQGGPVIQESPEEVAKEHRFSATDLVVLSGLPRAFDILEETIDAEVREELTRFAGNNVKRASTSLIQQIRGDEGYFISAPLTREIDFGCYVGYGMRNPDSYPRSSVGLYAEPEVAGSERAIEAIKRVSSLADWEDNLEDPTEWPEVWREISLINLLPEENHVAAVKRFFVESIRQLKEELTDFKKEHSDLPWEGC
jgi:hypothetical protein